MHSKKKNKTVH